MTRFTAALAALTDLFLPVLCAGCALPGPALCLRCAASFDGPATVQRRGVGPPIHALGTYRDTARQVVLAFKERGRRDLARPLGRMLAAVLPTLDDIGPADSWCFVPVPSTPRAARRRGGSHTMALARATAVALSEHSHHATVAPALGLRGARDSAGLDARARRANLTGRVKYRSTAAPPPGTGVVLLDDIVTTGATATACVGALLDAGVDVRAVVVLTAT